jgi:hypothetical protein
MEKKKLIDRLVGKALACGKGKAGCVPCFAGVGQPPRASVKK